MTWKFAALALALVLSSAAHAQGEVTPLDIAIQTCIAPGFVPDGDPYELVANLPKPYCERACRGVAKGCKDVAKTIDQCGVKFLKAVIKVGTEVCRGLGGTSQQCLGVAAQVNPDIDWWKAQGKLERADCDTEIETNCLSRCPSAAGDSDFPRLSPPSWSSPMPSGGRIISNDGPYDDSYDASDVTSDPQSEGL